MGESWLSLAQKLGGQWGGGGSVLNEEGGSCSCPRGSYRAEVPI